MSEQAFRTAAEPTCTPVMHMKFPGGRFLKVDLRVDQVRIRIETTLDDNREAQVSALVGKLDALRIAGALLRAVTMLPDDERANDDEGVEVNLEDIDKDYA